MILSAKNSGRTVFGVRIGLESVSAAAHQNRASQLTATPSIAAGEMRCLRRGIMVSLSPASCRFIILLVPHLLVSCSSPSCPRPAPSPPIWSHLGAVTVLALPSRYSSKIMYRIYPIEPLVVMELLWLLWCLRRSSGCRRGSGDEDGEAIVTFRF